MRSPKLFMDETRAPVLDPGRERTKTGYLWAIARDDRAWGGSDPPAVAYLYAPGRGHRSGDRPDGTVCRFLRRRPNTGVGRAQRRGHAQRVFGISLGYADLVDHDELCATTRARDAGRYRRRSEVAALGSGNSGIVLVLDKSR
jgi:hypothetical protein